MSTYIGDRQRNATAIVWNVNMNVLHQHNNIANDSDYSAELSLQEGIASVTIATIKCDDNVGQILWSWSKPEHVSTSVLVHVSVTYLFYGRDVLLWTRP